MVLKRKRSLSELCASPSSVTPSSAASSFSFSSPPARSLGFTHMSPRASLASPAHLNSRTMKRFRDNRPSEEEVHQRTLDVLFAAQRQHHNDTAPQPRPLAPQHQQTSSTDASSSLGQQSLHRFWNIGTSPSSVKSLPSAHQQMSVHTSCEDCGSALDSGDAMDLDESSADNSACGACGKHVCFSCSVSKLGEDKRCLQCAGRKVWVGGVGWTNADVSVC